MTDEAGQVVGVAEIRITAPFVRADGSNVSESGEITVRNLADQTEDDLLTYARVALNDKLGAKPMSPAEYVELIRRIETWPWEEYVFPIGTKVRPRDGGPKGTVTHIGVDGFFVTGDEAVYGVWDPWDLVPVPSQ